MMKIRDPGRTWCAAGQGGRCSCSPSPCIRPQKKQARTITTSPIAAQAESRLHPRSRSSKSRHSAISGPGARIRRADGIEKPIVAITRRSTARKRSRHPIQRSCLPIHPVLPSTSGPCAQPGHSCLLSPLEYVVSCLFLHDGRAGGIQGPFDARGRTRSCAAALPGRSRFHQERCRASARRNRRGAHLQRGQLSQLSRHLVRIRQRHPAAAALGEPESNSVLVRFQRSLHHLRWK